MTHTTKQATNINVDLENRLARYVAMPTVTADRTACFEGLIIIARELRKIGFKVQTFASDHPWLIATTRPNSKHVRVLLNAHLDVVPANKPDQFVMRIEGERLIGRGVFDMKFAIASYMKVLAELAKSDDLDAYNLGVLLTTDEEKGGFDGAKVFVDQGWTTDVAIVPDGGRDFKIEKRAKGFSLVYLNAHGNGAHSSRPWEGINPLHKLLPAIQEINAKYPNNKPDQPTVVVNNIEAPKNSALTQLSPHNRARIDIRAFTKEEMDVILIYLKDIAKKYDLDYTHEIDGAPVHLQENNPLVQTFIQCQESILGESVTFTEALGASDARFFAAKGMATIVEYPTGGSAHAHGEWLSRKALTQFYLIIRDFVSQAALDRAGISTKTRLLATPKKVMRGLLARKLYT